MIDSSSADIKPSAGMSLRAYIAAHSEASALAFVKNMTQQEIDAVLGIKAADYDYTWHWPALVAKARVLFADALLVELAKSGK